MHMRNPTHFRQLRATARRWHALVLAPLWGLVVVAYFLPSSGVYAQPTSVVAAVDTPVPCEHAWWLCGLPSTCFTTLPAATRARVQAAAVAASATPWRGRAAVEPVPVELLRTLDADAHPAAAAAAAVLRARWWNTTSVVAPAGGWNWEGDASTTCDAAPWVAIATFEAAEASQFAPRAVSLGVLVGDRFSALGPDVVVRLVLARYLRQDAAGLASLTEAFAARADLPWMGAVQSVLLAGLYGRPVDPAQAGLALMLLPSPPPAAVVGAPTSPPGAVPPLPTGPIPTAGTDWLRSEVLRLAGQDADARAALGRVLAADGLHPGALVGRAAMLRAEGQGNESLADLGFAEEAWGADPVVGAVVLRWARAVR